VLVYPPLARIKSTPEGTAAAQIDAATLPFLTTSGPFDLAALRLSRIVKSFQHDVDLESSQRANFRAVSRALEGSRIRLAT